MTTTIAPAYPATVLATANDQRAFLQSLHVGDEILIKIRNDQDTQASQHVAEVVDVRPGPPIGRILIQIPIGEVGGVTRNLRYDSGTSIGEDDPRPGFIGKATIFLSRVQPARDTRGRIIAKSDEHPAEPDEQTIADEPEDRPAAEPTTTERRVTVAELIASGIDYLAAIASYMERHDDNLVPSHVFKAIKAAERSVDVISGFAIVSEAMQTTKDTEP